MTYKTIKVEKREEGICILTLHRPEALNAINLQLIDDFNAVMDWLSREFDVRVLIITGADRPDGRPAFSAGLDLKDATVLAAKKVPESAPDWFKFPDTSKKFFQFQKELTNTIRKMRTIPQPVISAIKGAAVGWGLAVACASDFRIAGKSSRFINAFIRIGVGGADCGVSYFLPRLIGLSKATEIIMTGRDVTGEEMDQLGFLYKLVDDKELIDEALSLAGNLLEKSPLGLRLTKEALVFNVDAPSLETALALEDRSQNIAFQAKDSKEGVYSFFEKRKPKYGLR
ncbi:MAG: enoyl-CoA hydratase/isomerase family protein [Candidatus Hodarchaeota archaeon]